MFPLVLVLFLVVPIVELYVIVQVAGGIGVLETIGLLILVSILGAWLMRVEGVGVLRRIQQQLAAGTMPGRELVDGGLIMFAGALMLTPGFVTDLLGIVLLVPPTRALVRTVLMRRFSGRVRAMGFGPGGTGFGPGGTGFGPGGTGFGPGGAGPRGGGFGFGKPTIFDVRGDERRPDDVDASRDDQPRRDPPTLGR